MKKKIGFSILAITLLATALLFVVGAPPVYSLRVIHVSGQAMMIDSSWQPRWYAFALAGCLITGIVFVVLASRSKKSS